MARAGWILALSLILTVVPNTWAAVGPASNDQLMQEGFQQFDQNTASGWNVLMLQRDYADAAAVMRRYAEVNSSKLATWQKGSLAFHLGRVYALEGARDEAIAAFRQALASNGLSNTAYVQALIAFLEGDRAALVRDRSIVAQTDPGPWRKADLAEIDELIKYFGRPYEAAFGALSCVDHPRTASDGLWAGFCEAVKQKYTALYRARGAH